MTEFAEAYEEVLFSAEVELALAGHDGQKDKLGEPYFRHLMRVASAVSHLGTDAVMAAFYHDVLEDTSVIVEQLREAGVSERAVGLVLALTRAKPGETYNEYIQRIIDHPDDTVAKIKMADLGDNMARCSMLEEPDRTRLIKKYLRSYRLLAERLGVTL
jgi:(p)ppGpp synthase/HD superfamily hydrolase